MPRASTGSCGGSPRSFVGPPSSSTGSRTKSLADKAVLVEHRERKTPPAALGRGLVYLEDVLKIEQPWRPHPVETQAVEGRQQGRPPFEVRVERLRVAPPFAGDPVDGRGDAGL